MSNEARFGPGEWYAVVGDGVTVLLPVSSRDRVADLWDLADGGADADVLLDALLAGGLSSLEDFALVAHEAETTRVIVRGAPAATVSSPSGDELVRAGAGSTWAERLVTGRAGVRITLTGDGLTEADHPLTPGVSRVSVVELGAPAAPVSAAPPQEAAAAVPEAEPVPPAAAPVVSDALADDWSDRDGQTQAGAPFRDVERSPIAGQDIAPYVVSEPVAALLLSTGDVVAVDRTVLVGRAPEARRFASHDQPRIVTVPSPQQEISSTHLEIRPGSGADQGSAIATDLGSTNGTVLAQPGLDAEELKPGIAVSLVPGAVLDLGDGVTIQVTHP